MRRIYVFPLLALAAIVGLIGGGLAGCTSPLPAAPVESANATTLDERGALAFEVAYRAAGAALEVALASGKLHGADAARANEIDARAYAAVLAARAAYDAGNAASYVEAVERAQALTAQLRAATAPATGDAK